MNEVDEKLILSSEDKDRMHCLGAELHLKIKEETQSDVTEDEKRLDQLPLQRTIKFKSEPDVEEFVIKHEADDVQLENEELVIKNEDEVGIDRHTIATKFRRYNIALHGELSEVAKVTPNFESTKSNHRGNTKQVLGHEGVKKFICYDCGYKSQQKSKLQDHVLIHKHPSQLQMFQCTECSFQCKRKRSLQNHLVVHKNPTQIKMYKCTACSFESKHRISYWTHSQLHKVRSKDEMFACGDCEYKCKIKQYLKKHRLIHKDPSQIKTFKCDECSYEGKHEFLLRNHQMMHRNQSIYLLKCDKCSYFCKRKISFKRHLKTHQNH